MSLGRLLAAGKSLVGLRAGESRYRADKSVQLPKFGSTKNPFAPVDAPMEPTVEAPEAAKAPVATPVSVTLSAIPETPAAPQIAAGKETGVEKKILQVAAGAASAAGWLGDWGRKLNPLKRTSKSGRVQMAPVPGSRPQQAEFSLDDVKVVRNDLSDADFEVRQSPAKPGLPVVAKTAEKLEPVGAALSRITTRFLGDQP